VFRRVSAYFAVFRRISPCFAVFRRLLGVYTDPAKCNAAGAQLALDNNNAVDVVNKGSLY